MPPLLVACPDCDLLLHCPDVPSGGEARCPRCEAVLVRDRPDSLNRTLALTSAGAVLFLVANAFPFLAFVAQGQETQTTLGSGVLMLWDQGWPPLAMLVGFTTILAPALQLALLAYVTGPLRFGWCPPQLARAMRALQHLQPWSMMEVFLIGILVALVKLADMADIVPGVALWAFAVLIPVLAGTLAALDPRVVWRHVEIET